MDIVIVTSYWKNSDGGGIKKYIVTLSDELEKKGKSIKVIFRLGSDPSNIKGPHNKFLFSLIAFCYLMKLRPAAIQTMGGWYCMLPAVLYKKLSRCRVVGAFHTEPEEKLPWGGRFLMQTLIDNCDYITFGSKRLVEIMENLWGLQFNNTIIEVTPAGIKSSFVPESLMEDFRNNFAIDDDSIILLSMGLTALKHKAEGAKLLIKSMNTLKAKYPSIKLIFTREGRYSQELMELAKNEGVDENVIFTGDIENAQVPLSLCDIYVHTPLGEGGVPQSLLEAMIMGKPIVATNVGGIPEAIYDKKNGILVNPDSDEIAEGIVALLEDRDYAHRLGENAKKTVIKEFSWSTLADRFIDMYGLR